MTSNPAATTDILMGLYHNGAIDRASVELHFDEETPTSSTIEFGALAAETEGWFNVA